MMPIVKPTLTPTQARVVSDMQRHPERPLSIRRLDRRRMVTANALCTRGLLDVRQWDATGVDFVLTETGKEVDT